jgi:hypothetical protein
MLVRDVDCVERYAHLDYLNPAVMENMKLRTLIFAQNVALAKEIVQLKL